MGIHFDNEYVDLAVQSLEEAQGMVAEWKGDNRVLLLGACIEAALTNLAEFQKRDAEFTEALTCDVPGVYLVMVDSAQDPRAHIWSGYALNPVNALSACAVAEGFVEYESQPMLRDMVMTYALDEDHSRLGACATFTNTVLYALRIAEHGRCDQCSLVLEPMISDVDGSIEMVCQTHGHRTEYAVVEPWLKDGIGPRYPELTTEGRWYAEQEGHQKQTAAVALQGYGSAWPDGHVRTAINIMNEEGKKTLTWERKRDYLKEHAGLLYEIGTILVDREPDNAGGGQGTAPPEQQIWHYLYGNLSSLYDLAGQTIDAIETEIFG